MKILNPKAKPVQVDVGGGSFMDSRLWRAIGPKIPIMHKMALFGKLHDKWMNGKIPTNARNLDAALVWSDQEEGSHLWWSLHNAIEYQDDWNKVPWEKLYD
jgi:hypothetical protein